MFFATYLFPGESGAPSNSKNSTTAVVSGVPAMRNARVNARRRIASRRHCSSGCNHAPRPGRLPAASTVAAHLPFPSSTATTRSSSTANSRLRQPTHVRTGPWGLRCDRAREDEASRWITVQSSLTVVADRNASRPPGSSRSAPTLHRTRAGWQTGCAHPAGCASLVSASLRISMRQPVSRAASRAF